MNIADTHASAKLRYLTHILVLLVIGAGLVLTYANIPEFVRARKKLFVHAIGVMTTRAVVFDSYLDDKGLSAIHYRGIIPRPNLSFEAERIAGEYHDRSGRRRCQRVFFSVYEQPSVGRIVGSRNRPEIMDFDEEVHHLGIRSRSFFDDIAILYKGSSNPPNPNIRSVGRLVGFLRSIGRSLGLGSQFVGSIGLGSRVVGQPLHLVDFALYLVQGLLQRLTTSIQRLTGETISPANLEPLQTREYCVSNQDEQASNLKAKFGVFPPLAAFISGYGLCGWGWWRLKTVSNRRQFAAGFGCLTGGFLIASLGLGTYLIIAV